MSILVGGEEVKNYSQEKSDTQEGCFVVAAFVAPSSMLTSSDMPCHICVEVGD